MNLAAALDIINFAHIGIPDPKKRIVAGVGKAARAVPGVPLKEKPVNILGDVLFGRMPNPPSHAPAPKPAMRWTKPKGKTPFQQHAIDADLAGEAGLRAKYNAKNGVGARLKKAYDNAGGHETAALAGATGLLGIAAAHDIRAARAKKAKETADAAELQRLRSQVSGKKASLAAAMDTIHLASGCMGLAGQPIPGSKRKATKKKKVNFSKGAKEPGVVSWDTMRAMSLARKRTGGKLGRFKTVGQAAPGGRNKGITPLSVGPNQLAAALDTINFVANPSGDPRPRNRQGQFANPEVDTDPVQQNKAAYDPTVNRRRTIARVAGAAAGVGAGLGLLKLRSVLKKSKGVGAPIA